MENTKETIKDKLAYAGKLKAEADEILDGIELLALLEIEPLVERNEFINAYAKLQEFFFGDCSECLQKFGIVSYIYDAEEAYNKSKRKSSRNK
jgi:hypothetical protein